MKKFLQEFKEFALKGNVMDMAIGVIIGGAFSSIVTALTESFINPLINSIGGAEVGGSIKLPWVDYSGLDAETAKSLTLNYGDFITAIINFLIIANLRKKEEVEEEPTTKKCPFCFSEIDIKATKCPHCTSDIKE